MTAYATTKHAVVGLSTSLRVEKAALEVRVSVLCPGFIRTSIYEAATYVTKLRDESVFDWSSIKMMEPPDCARVILRGVARNKGIITVTPFASLLWAIHRLHPELVPLFFRKKIHEFRALRIES